MFLQDQERRAFYESSRFFEIARFVQGCQKPVSQEDVAYFPERYPFTADEFSMFCHALFLAHEKDIVEQQEGQFPSCHIDALGMKITLLIGQGSCFFAEKALKTR